MSVADRRERERQERRAQIVEAAANLFKSKGFTSATMDEIAAEAEVSKGTLYLHFKNKDDLFVALSSIKLDEIRGEFGRIARAGSPGLACLRDMLTAYAGIAMADPEMFRAAVVWLSCPDRADVDSPSFCEHRSRVVSVMQCLISTIERGQQDGSIRGDLDAQPLAGQIWGGMLGTLLIRVNAEELARRVPAPDIESNVPGFIALLCDGLRPLDIAP